MTTCTLPETIVSNTTDKPETIRKPKAMTIIPHTGELPETFPDDAPFALLTVDAPHGFVPDSTRSGFPSTANGFPEEVTAKLADAVNRSDWARQSERWMVRALSGGAILLRNIGGRRRPIYPDALPAAVEPLYVASEHEARNAAAERNEPRFAFAKAPRQWTVAIRNPRFGNADPLAARRNVERNPLAEKLVDMYLPVWQRIEADLPDGVSVGGADAVEELEDGSYQALSDERLYSEAEIEIQQTLLYDLRGDIESNVANALREFAHELLDAAQRLTPGNVRRGSHLVIEGDRVVGRFQTAAAAGGFAGGFGGDCQIAELVEAEPATVGAGAEGAGDVSA